MASAGGTAIQQFTTWLQTTPQSVLTPPKKIINDATNQRYMLRFMERGQKYGETGDQSGSKVTDQLMLNFTSTAARHLPDDDIVLQPVEDLTEWSANWRYFHDQITWTEQQLMHQKAKMSKASAYNVWKDYWFHLMQRMASSMAERLNDEIFAVPNKDTMEAAGGRQPYSLFALVNEWTSGLWGFGNSEAWSTVQGINPVAEPNWVPQTWSYALADYLGTTDIGDSLWDAFSDAQRALRLEPLPMGMDQYSNPMDWSDYEVFCSFEGDRLYRRAVYSRSSDGIRTAGNADLAIGDITFAGRPIRPFPQFDTAAVYDDGASGYANEANASPDGPRFYILPREHFKKHWHSEKYLDFGDVDRPNLKINRYYQLVESWNINLVTSRKRCGIIVPT